MGILEKLPGFGANIARRARVESIELPGAFQTAIARDPILEQPVRELTAAYLAGDNKLAFALANPMLSNDPVLNSMGKALYGAQLDRDYKLAQWDQKLLGEFKPRVGEVGSPVDAELSSAIRGFTPTSNPVVQELRSKRNDWLRDLAAQTEDPKLATWTRWNNDADALYDSFRQALHVPAGHEGIVGTTGMFKTYESLDDAFKLTMDKNTYSNLVGVFARRMSFSELTAAEQATFKSGVMNRYRYTDAIPSDVRKRVPDFFAQQYLLADGAKYLEDSGIRQVQNEVFHYQHRASTERISQVLQPLIDLLPGKVGALGRLIPSRRQFAQDMLDQFVSNAKTGDEQMLQRTFTRANDALLNPILEAAGVDIRDPLTVSRARDVSGAILRGEYRGFLSIDTAFLDMSLGLNTWAETGRFSAPFLQAIRAVDWKGNVAGTPVHLAHERFGYLLEAKQLDRFGLLKTTPEKLKWLDQKITDTVLHPMMFMHNLQRGAAYLAGVEKALAAGVDGTVAHRTGLATASQYVEDLTLTKAQMAAFETMAKATFGFSKVETPPILQGPLGKISFMFMNWTNNQAQALVNGVGRAYGEADTEGLLRYLSLLGFHTALPSYFAFAGVDITKFVVGGDLQHFTVPFWRQMTDAIHAAAGSVNEIIGETPSVQQVRAQERTLETFKGALIPQYRAGKDFMASADAIKTGYRLDDNNKLWYYSSPMGELLRAVGVRPSQVKATREAVEEIRNRTAIYHHEKQRAMVDVMQGDLSGAERFQAKYGVPITLGDIQNFAAGGSQDPASRAYKQTPRALKPGARSLVENIP